MDSKWLSKNINHKTPNHKPYKANSKSLNTLIIKILSNLLIQELMHYILKKMEHNITAMLLLLNMQEEDNSLTILLIQASFLKMLRDHILVNL
jgi:hypothetical protein